MKPRLPAIWIYALVIFLGRLLPLAAAEPEGLVKLREQYHVAQAQADQPMSAFIVNYTRSLDAAKTTAQNQGDLDAVLAVEAEIKKARAGGVGQNATYAPLHDLQKAFAKQLAQAQAAAAAEKQRLAGAYATALEGLQKSLTQAGNLDGAVVVKGELEKISKSNPQIRSSAETHEELAFVDKRWITGSGSRFIFHADGTGFQESDAEGRVAIKWKKGDNNLFVVNGESGGHRKATYYFRFDDTKSGVFGTAPNKLNRVISLK
jgi:hypothetical protein